ncbi:MAG: carboxypeptidase regulatory-like domain-containing protein [Planctomycetes bacterium]|nr:carboxypeptidase regulatory-like domain-containing protein [Planctomycetota bacterium]
MRPQPPLRKLTLVLVSASMSWLPAQVGQARLEGAVLDAHRQPVPGAIVTARLDGVEVARACSDGSGSFALPRLPQAELAIRATTAPPDVGGALVDLRDTTLGFARIAMMPARRLAGIVRDETGAPMAGAFVAFAPPGPAEFGAIADSTTTDARGRFEFAHVPFGPIAVRCWHAERAGLATTIDSGGDADVEFAFDDEEPQRRRFELAGASSQQTAQARLEVMALAGQARVPLPAAVARPTRGEDGAWLVLGWTGDDAMWAHVVLDDAFVEPVFHDIPPDTGDRTKRFYVESAANSIIRGRLFADDGIAIGNRRLVAIGGRRGGGMRSFAITDDEGTFELPTPTPTNTDFLLRCLDPDVALVPPASRSWFEGTQVWLSHRPDQQHELELRPAARLHGTLQDATGAPYRGAEVVLLVAHGPQVQSMARIGEGGFHQVRGSEVFGRGHTDAAGRLVLPGAALEAGMPLTLQFLGPLGFLQHEVAFDGEDTDLGVLRTTAGATIRGAVQRPDGTPWPGAQIEVEDFCLTRHEYRITADRDGRFTLPGLAGGPTWIGLAGTKRGQLVTLEAGEAADVTLR